MAQFSDNSALAMRTLATGHFRILRRSLIELSHQPDSVLITEADLPAQWLSDRGWSTFLLLITVDTQGLLIQTQPEPGAAAAVDADLCNASIMTNPQSLNTVIVSLLEAGIKTIPPERLLLSQQRLRDRTPASEADLMLSLLPSLVGAQTPPFEASPATSEPPSTHYPVQVALDRQIEQGLLLNQVTTKIRQSLDLASILSTTVDAVRQFLDADRLLIYQFHHVDAAATALQTRPAASIATGSSSFVSSQVEPHSLQQDSYITYESIASEYVDSVQHFTEKHCFDDYIHAAQKYRTDSPIYIDDIETRYQHSPCLLKCLRKAQVKTKVIAPILVQGDLWGLLIVHHCRAPRQWQSRQLTFLQHIAENIAIAVQQAELYEQLQQQTQSLESCINDQTQDLRDALTAAQTANLAKSEFLATMSHELRTPLTCIIGMSATLLRWSFGELSPRQRSYLTTIYQSGERLLAIINDILAITKIESGRTVLAVEPFSLTALAQKSLEPFREETRDRDVELTFENTLLPEQDAFTGDPQRIQQILGNLLSNAVKFTANEGQVNLRIRRENQTAVLQVEDTGIGIPESQIGLLFEKFQQLENSRQRQYPGTGLGLALTKQLVELHGGNIQVNSRVGVGSVFTVRLPMLRQNATKPAHDLPEELPPASPVVGRIVLVEDQEETAGLICDLLTAADYQVIWVIEGSQLIEQVALLQPTIVIVNTQLDGFDGRRLIQTLRESLITAEVKVLALTPSQDGAPELEEADATILAPFDPESLLQQVNALVSQAESQQNI